MINEKEISLVKKLFRSLEERRGGAPRAIDDLFVYIDLSSGEVSLYDDREELLTTNTVYTWQKPDYKVPSEQMIRTLNYAVMELEVEGYWDREFFRQPLHVTLVDRDFQMIEELYYLDRDLAILSQPLLDGLDDELGDFLDKLLPEIK